MVPVKSSNLKEVGYDAAARELHVSFHGNPETYSYEDVPPEEHAALMAASSVGSYYHHNIRNGAYKHSKVAVPVDATNEPPVPVNICEKL